MKRAKLMIVSMGAAFSFIVQPLYIGTVPAFADNVPTSASTSTSTMPAAQGTSTQAVVNNQIMIFTLLQAIPAPAPTPSPSPISSFRPIVSGAPSVTTSGGTR